MTKIHEDKRFLQSEDDIEDFVTDIARDYMECGQGFYTDEAEFTLKIGDKYYLAEVSADIASAKQEYGDRLYWIDSVELLNYDEIPMPVEKYREEEPKEDTVTIPRVNYEDLKNDSIHLSILEARGVDNWGGYVSMGILCNECYTDHSYHETECTNCGELLPDIDDIINEY